MLMEWSTAYINSLPDSCFAYIEPGGKKDDEGKTVPRSLRHLPFKDENGKVDLPHLRNALARLPQSNLSTEAKAKARAKLIAAAKEHGVGDYDKLAELKIPFFRLGRWKHPKYGTIEGTQQMFDQMKANFKRQVLGRQPFVRIGHDKDGKDVFGAAPAEAWIKDVVQEDDYLYAVADTTNDEVAKAVQEKRYRFASAEYDPNYADKETGLNAGAVLSAVALTNEPFLTRLPDAVVLADPEKIYLDYEEDAKMGGEKLLEENNSLLKKLTETFTGFVDKFKPGQGSGLSEDEKKKLAELDDTKTKLTAAESKLAAIEADQVKTKLALWTATVESRIKDLVAKGIPPAMCEQARTILMANPAYETTMIKLADGKEVSMADQVFATLEALPTEHRIKMGQLGEQTSPPPVDSPEAIKKMADEDVKAMGGKVTEDGKYVI
jgi:hypothetical protein